jgi:hypothetical protein
MGDAGIISFFANSCYLGHEVLRPLSHILGFWELDYDPEKEEFVEEDDSCAGLLNVLHKELEHTAPPARYHDNEDCLAQYVVEHLGWPIHKGENRWEGADYDSIIEQGGFDDLNERNLVLAAAGRIRAAIIRGQKHFDHMEASHRRMLAAVISIILYHRTRYLENQS